LEEVQKIVYARKERKNGKRNVLKGKTVVSTPEVLEELKKCKAQANSKKKKRRPRETRNRSKAIPEVESTSEEDEEDEGTEVFDVIDVACFQPGCK